MRADYILAAVRTGSAGAGGISLLLIDADSPGIERRAVPGLRWYNASIGTLEFRDVRVPLDRLIGAGEPRLRRAGASSSTSSA